MNEKFLNVLIVDDEEIVRNGFKNIIDWKKCGCQICGEAANGEDAIEKIKELKPSIVLLDINMPGVSGIDILQKVHDCPEEFPSRPDFLILSGYSDFDYAQKAMNYGAKGYIVKPVDEELLEKKICMMVEEILREDEADSLRSNAQAEELVHKFSQMFLFGSADEAFAATDNGEDRYVLALVSPELSGFSGQLQALKAAIDESFRLTNHIAFSLEPVYVILFKNESEEVVLRHIERFCTRIQKNRKGSIVALGQQGTGLSGALNSYNQAKKLFSQLFFFMDRPFITQKDMDTDTDARFRIARGESEMNEKDFFECIPNLVQFIEIYDLQRIESVLSQQEEWLRRSTLSIQQIKKICMAFIVELQNGIHTKHPEKEFETVPAMDLVNLIYSQNYFAEVSCIVRDFSMGLAESFTSNTSNSTILKVIQYVKSNYNTDLKLEMLGNLFNCNSAYLGKKFREYTGVPFNTYLDIIRIEEAKNMLVSSGLKIYEISKLVGYTNTDYFYLKFKKHTNMTPKEYKNSRNAEG